MTKHELIKQLENYNDDAEVEVRIPGAEPVWYVILEVANYKPHTPDHALLTLTEGPVMY